MSSREGERGRGGAGGARKGGRPASGAAAERGSGAPRRGGRAGAERAGRPAGRDGQEEREATAERPGRRRGAAAGGAAPGKGGGAGRRPDGSGRGTTGAARKGTGAARPKRPRAAPVEAMRIQRALARAGIAARRKAETLVAEGRVTVNGSTATIGQVVEPGRDRILVDGEPLPTIMAAEWFLLHKPVGMLTSRGDAEGRPTVFDIAPDLPGLTYVGRLDYMTEGVLLLTTDGAAAHALTHPSRGVERVYVATVRGNAVAAAAQARRGVELEDGLVVPVRAEARSIGQRLWELELVLTEGRTREVRRLCEALGLDVQRLVRTRYGPVELGRLASGAVRPLTSRELIAIRSATSAGGREGGRPRR